MECKFGWLFILSLYSIESYTNIALYLHEDHEKNNTFKSEILAEGVDDQIDHEEGILNHQHGAIPRQRQLHLQLSRSPIGTRQINQLHVR